MRRPRYFDYRDCLAILTLGLPWFVFFARATWSQQVIAIRDGSHYYWPLYRWLATRQRAGEWPLWNPLENAGVSLAADPTAALWYPLKLLLLLPLPGATPYNIYLVCHALLGLCGVVFWLRSSRWCSSSNLTPDSTGRLSRGATYLAAVTYIYGGPFLFQYSNVIYLVGAAWLPWACRAIEQLVESRRLMPVLQLAVILALITLGGDPQMSYHLGILALVRVALHPQARNRGELRISRWEQFRRLGLAGLLACALAAIQILPAWQAVQRSGRTNNTASSSTESRDLAAETHEQSRYEFSVGPWQYLEMIWPNVGGRLFPINQRWWSTLPADGRVWCPTLFMGVLPASLALSVLSIRTRVARVRWMSVTLLGAMWAASGWYGVGWLWKEISLACGWSSVAPALPSEWGSGYWLLVKLLPGYSSFRYPGKWLVVVNLAIAILAAHAWHHVWTRVSMGSIALISSTSCCLRRWYQTLSIMLGLSLAVLAISLSVVGLGWWHHWQQQAPTDAWLGPLNINGAARDLIQAGIQTSVVCAAAWWFLRWLTVADQRLTAPISPRHPLVNPEQPIRRHVWGVVLLITCIDLIWANSWLVQTLPTNAHRELPSLANQTGRIWRADWSEWLPHAWAESSDPHRLQQTQSWEQQTFFPKSNLHLQLAVVSREESFLSADWLEFWDQAARHGWIRPDGGHEPSADMLSLFGISEVILPAGSKIPATSDRSSVILRQDPATSEMPEVDRWQLLTPMPRAWLVNKVVRVSAGESNQAANSREQTTRVLKAIGPPCDWSRLAVVESNDSDDLRSLGEQATSMSSSNLREDKSTASQFSGTARIKREYSNTLELEVDSPCPALCILADRYDLDWRVSVTSEIDQGDENPVERRSDYSTRKLLRTNRLLRGVIVPAGKSIIVFQYRPQSLIAGMIVSLTAISVLALLLIWAWQRDQSDSPTT